MTLHQAIIEVVRDAGGSCPVADVVTEIARRDLYRKDDGRHPQRPQVAARISNYKKGNKKGCPELFDRPSPGVVALTPHATETSSNA